MRLCEAPVGLFLFGDTLCMMTEYSSEGCGRHAYIVSSGEMFWGGAKSKEERANLEVTPVEVRLDELSPRWISTKESLPESNDRVLVRAVLSIFVVAVWDNEEGVWRATWDYNVIEPEYVTHWMPLPEPPGEEDDTQ